MLTVNHIETIRRKVLIEGLSQREVARELKHSRNTIKNAIANPSPRKYRLTKDRARPALEPVREIVEAWLKADLEQPVKQRHDATRIYQRLVTEYQYHGSYGTIQRHVRRWKQQNNYNSRERYIPLEFKLGEEAQVDWGEAVVVLGGEQRTLNFFCIRCAYSRAIYVRAYEHQDQVSFLDGHVRAFEFLGGVPRRMAYDNLKTAVISVGRGKERTLNAKFIELRSHYLFESRFCNVAKGNEKGHVENLVKHVQRSFLTPVPKFATLGEVNDFLETACRQELLRPIVNTTSSSNTDETEVVAEASVPPKSLTIGDQLAEERPKFLPLPSQPFAACIDIPTTVSKQCLVRVDNCDYSVPSEYAYQDCLVRKYVDRIEIIYACMLVATHAVARSNQRFQLDPWHYLDILERKPGALNNGRPFANDAFGADLSLMHRELQERRKDDGNKEFIRILMLGKLYRPEEFCEAVSYCVKMRAFSADAVECTLRNHPLDTPRIRLDLSNQPELSHSGDGIRSAADYDRLYQLQADSDPFRRMTDDDACSIGRLPENSEAAHDAA